MLGDIVSNGQSKVYLEYLLDVIDDCLTSKSATSNVTSTPTAACLCSNNSVCVFFKWFACAGR